MAKLQQENKFNVPKSAWRKWPDVCQRVFNMTYEYMNGTPKAFVHPKAAAVPQEHWNTTAWNAAWIAADNTLQALKDIEAGVGYYTPEKGKEQP